MVMLWIALAVFWLLGAVGRARFAIRFGWTDAAVLLLVGWHTVAAVWATRHGTPRPAVNMLWEWIGMGLGFLLARQLIVTSREARAVAAVMIALAVALSGDGLYQFLYETPQTQAKYAADPDRALREAGLWYPPGSHERERFESRLHNREPLGTFALTNSLAAFLAPWLVMLAAATCSCGRNGKRLLSMALCATPVAVCLLLTKSRSGFVAVGVGAVFVWLTCRQRAIHVRWKWPVAAVGAVVVVAAIATMSRLDHGLLERASKSFGYRLQYWQSSWQMITDHPVLGCGPGNFQNAYTRYKLPEASEEVADPHNFLFEIWATAGTPAMLALLAVLACFVVEGGRRKAEGGIETAHAGCDSSVSTPQSLIPNPSPHAHIHVLVGGVLGFLLSVPMGLLSAAAPAAVTIHIGSISLAEPAAVLLGLPLAAATIALLWGWIRDGRWSTSWPVVGVAVLLVDLLATGGIGLPSIAGTLWLLLALGLQGRSPWELRPRAAWAALAAALALAVACYATAYNPVFACQAQLRMAEREPTSAVEHLAAAAAADPLSAEPRRQLAAIQFETWRRAPDERIFHAFEQSDAQTLQRTPNSALSWLNSGDWYSRAWQQTEASTPNFAADCLAKAVKAYRQAVLLYPHSAVYRAKLAEALRASGDLPTFHREAQTALELDRATPHADKKLTPMVRDRLSQQIGETP